MLSLLDTLKHHAITIVPDFSYGKMQREGSQWLHAIRFEEGPASFDLVYFGDFKQGLSEVWQSETSHFTEEQLKKVSKAKREAQKESKRIISDEQIRVKNEVNERWPTFVERGATAYMERKKVKELYGCKLDSNDHGFFLLVPLRDIDGTLWNYQRIYNQKLSAGDKFLLAGGRVDGLFHLLGSFDDASEIFIAEGFATASSIFEALGQAKPVVAAIAAGNLSAVGSALRGRFPQAKLVFCADDDQWTTRPSGEPYNPGIEAAREAAHKVGGETRRPIFASVDTRPTDFNDLHLLQGIEEVTRQFTDSAVAQAGMVVDDTPRGEAGLVASILADHAGNLVKLDRDIFTFAETHWAHTEPGPAADYFRKLIDGKAAGKLKFKDISSAHNRLMIHIPTSPVNLFAPPSHLMSFKNCVVELSQREDGSYGIETRPHRREDYLMYCHPFNYEREAGLNDEFERVLEAVLAGEGLEQSRQAYYEVLGATLVPSFPKIVLFVGPPQSGKSTLAIFASKLVSQNLQCSVDPSRMFGFNLSTMAGKLVNIDTDINTQKPISDDLLKKIEDRRVVRIERKFMSDLYGPLPAMHIFAANRMPGSNGDSVDAYDRRMLVFRCDGWRAEPGKFIRDYAPMVFNKNPAGILTRAIQGLEALCKTGGHFTEPERSKAEKAAWKEAHQNPVQAFIADIRDGVKQLSQDSWKIVDGGQRRVERGKLWAAFSDWWNDYAPRQVPPSRSRFFDLCRQAGLEDRKIEGVRYFAGLSIVEAQNSIA